MNSFDDVEKVIGQLPQDLADKIVRYMEFVAELTVEGTTALKNVLVAI